MDFENYRLLVATIKIGKWLPDSIYIHQSAISSIPDDLIHIITQVSVALNIPANEWNIVKFYRRDLKVTFLHYPDFDCYSYPVLHHSYTVDLAKLTVRKASYENLENAPILHRKETLVESDFDILPALKGRGFLLPDAHVRAQECS